MVTNAGGDESARAHRFQPVSDAAGEPQPIEVEPDPVFLVGARRSGSTLMRVMLDFHPRICFPRHFEIELAVQFIGGGIRDRGALPESLAPYYDSLESTYEFRNKAHEIDRSLGLRALLDSFLRQSQGASGKPVVMAAVHDHFGRLIRIWPKARFLYLLRDGRDVARSRIALGWDGNYWAATAPWIVAEREWEELQEVVPADRRMELKYEDLVGNTVAELGRVCEFIGIPYDDAIFDYLRATSYERPDPKLVAQWRRKLSENEVRLAEARLAPRLRARGYELSGLPAVEVSPASIRKLERQSRWARRRADLRRHGLRLFLLAFITRSLGATRWQKKIELEIDTRRQGSLL